jgi:hypothetical protein
MCAKWSVDPRYPRIRMDCKRVFAPSQSQDQTTHTSRSGYDARRSNDGFGGVAARRLQHNGGDLGVATGSKRTLRASRSRGIARPRASDRRRPWAWRRCVVARTRCSCHAADTQRTHHTVVKLRAIPVDGGFALVAPSRFGTFKASRELAAASRTSIANNVSPSRRGASCKHENPRWSRTRKRGGWTGVRRSFRAVDRALLRAPQVSAKRVRRARRSRFRFEAPCLKATRSSAVRDSLARKRLSLEAIRVGELRAQRAAPPACISAWK